MILQFYSFALALILLIPGGSYTILNQAKSIENHFTKSSIELTDCTFNGIPLYGKVKVVESFPDLKIKIVSSFPDLDVKLVESFANDCGEWQMVESFPDFTIQFVESFPDIEIKYVESFPGLP